MYKLKNPSLIVLRSVVLLVLLVLSNGVILGQQNQIKLRFQSSSALDARYEQSINPKHTIRLNFQSGVYDDKNQLFTSASSFPTYELPGSNPEYQKLWIISSVEVGLSLAYNRSLDKEKGVKLSNGEISSYPAYITGKIASLYFGTGATF